MKKIICNFILSVLIFTNAYSTNISTDLKVETLSGVDYYITDNADLYLSGITAVLTNCKINLTSENNWIYFENVRPSIVASTYLNQIYVNNSAAVLNTNVRIEIFKQGTVVIPHSSDYEALRTFSKTNFTGTNKNFAKGYHRNLGDMNDKIRSIILKKGYMVTFSTLPNGQGYSRVFVADDSDIEIPVLPHLLNGRISFIRVLNWKWVTKKGYCNHGLQGASDLQVSWRYDWGAGTESTLDIEFIPMRHNLYWKDWASINNTQNSTAVLGFNEPERADQANMTVDQAISLWPKMMESGLRIGSPAVANDGGALVWLDEFMKKAEDLNYRVDFIAIHQYTGGLTATQLYNKALNISKRYGNRPVWYTEWNNGANWTNETWPATLAEQQEKQRANMLAFFKKLDEAPFFERWNVYNNVEEKRYMRFSDGRLTPAGEMMRDYNAGMAYNKNYDYTPRFKPIPIFIKSATTSSSGEILVSWDDKNYDLLGNSYLQRRVLGGSFETIAVFDSLSLTTTFNDSYEHENNKTYVYRVVRDNSYSGGQLISAEVSTQNDPMISKTDWKLISVDSEDIANGANNTGSKAFDDNPLTFWHTKWSPSVDVLPHQITIDLGKMAKVSGFGYLPRQDGNKNGNIAAFELHLSTDNQTWANPFHTGTFNDDSNLKRVFFDATVECKYIKLIAKSEINNKQFTNIAELNMYGVYADPNARFEMQNGFQKFDIYPNPVKSGKLYINVNDNNLSNCIITISDLQGRVVYEQQLANGYVNTSHIQCGIYILKITNNKLVNTQKIVIEN